MDDIEKLEKVISKKREKIGMLEKQKEKIISSNNTQKRKERTRQLIQMGALVEKYYGIHDVKTLEEFLSRKTGK